MMNFKKMKIFTGMSMRIRIKNKNKKKVVLEKKTIIKLHKNLEIKNPIRGK